tara:strand:+ start:452 stop:715 length:264 start_codon:yes stop_codon:yes gene_type:complete
MKKQGTIKRIFYEEVIKLLKESGPMTVRDILPVIKERRPIHTLKNLNSNRASQLLKQYKDIEPVMNVRNGRHSGTVKVWAFVEGEEE